MRLAICLLISVLVPFLVTYRLHKLGKCSVMFVILSPIVGLFAGLMGIIFLFLSSGDM